jgi:hypothetical protein
MQEAIAVIKGNIYLHQSVSRDIACFQNEAFDYDIRFLPDEKLQFLQTKYW